MEEQSALNWLFANLWLPTIGIIGALLTIIRQGDLHRIQALERMIKDTATKDSLLKLELLVERGVLQERFTEYMAQVELSRVEAREMLKVTVADIKAIQQRTDDKLSALIERVISYGLAKDQRMEPRG